MYPTDLTIYKKTLDFDNRKQKYDLCITWNAIYYIIKTGCQWRVLPSRIIPNGNWSTITTLNGQI